MSPEHAALLLGGGLIAGVLNTMAGAGSLFTVPLLDFAGLPGQLANGSNRVGVLAQSVSAAWRFRREGIPGLREARPLLIPTVAGAVLGAIAVSQLDDLQFKRLFGVLMLVLALPVAWGQRRARNTTLTAGALEGPVRSGVFFGIGMFGGAVQAGVGLALLAGLRAVGYDLVQANSVKVVLNAALVLCALPVFISYGYVAWPHALALATGYAVGGRIGVGLTVRGGERLLRPVVAVMVLALATRMLGWW